MKNLVLAVQNLRGCHRKRLERKLWLKGEIWLMLFNILHTREKWLSWGIWNEILIKSSSTYTTCNMESIYYYHHFPLWVQVIGGLNISSSVLMPLNVHLHSIFHSIFEWQATVIFTAFLWHSPDKWHNSKFSFEILNIVPKIVWTFFDKFIIDWNGIVVVYISASVSFYGLT